MDVALLTNLGHFGAWLYNDHLVTCDLKKRHIGIHNQSATAVWLLLNGVVSIKKLSQKYAEIFAISADQARRDVESCLTNWQAQGWVCKDVDGRWQIASTIVDRLFRTTFAIGLSYVPSTGLSKHDRTKETQSAFG
jgi:hypothetical protein